MNAIMREDCMDLLHEERGEHRAMSHTGPQPKLVKSLEKKAIALLSHEKELSEEVTQSNTDVTRHYDVEEHDRVLNSAAMVDSAGRPLGLQHQGGDISGTACPPIGYVQVFPRIVRILIQMLRLLSFVGCRFFSHVQLVLTCMRGRLTIRLRIDNNRCCRHIQFSPAVAIRIQR